MRRICCLVLVCAGPLLAACSMAATSHRLIAGDLLWYDAASNIVAIRADGRTVQSQLAPNAVVQEGAHIIAPVSMREFGGHYTKVTLEGGAPVAVRIMISPEKVVPGTVTAWDASGRVLAVSANDGLKLFPVDDMTWCHIGDQTIDAATLVNEVGDTVKVTVSLRTGRVLAVWVSRDGPPHE
jgi:hypothetical protein